MPPRSARATFAAVVAATVVVASLVVASDGSREAQQSATDGPERFVATASPGELLRCQHPGGVLGCLGAWRPGLSDEDYALLGLLEGDAQDCARDTGLFFQDGVHRLGGHAGIPTIASTAAWVAASDGGKSAGDASRFLTAISCGLPALLSFELLHVAWAFRRSYVTAAVPATEPADVALASAVAATRRDHEWWVRLAGRGVPDCASTRGILEKLRRCVDDYVQRVALPALAAAESSAASDRQPDMLLRRLAEVAVELAYGRRVLQWRVNALIAVAEFGLAEHFAKRLVLRERFFSSRVEVLLELLGSPRGGSDDASRAELKRELPCFAEVGVHLGRLSFALLSAAPSIRYIGVDPYSYGSTTESESVKRQLGDLGHTDAKELRETREAAQVKFDYFGSRAKLWVVPSVEAAGRLPDASLDGVFIDGDHSFGAVAEDIAAWEPKLRPGGFLAGHDFGNHPDVARAVLEHAERKNRTVHLAMDWVWYWHVP